MSDQVKEPTDSDLAAAIGLSLAEPTPAPLDPEPEVVAETVVPADLPGVKEHLDGEGDEPETNEPADAAPVAKAAPTINVDRVVERLFSQYSMSPDAVDAMDDATRLKTADALAVKVLKRANIPQRFIDQMKPEERVAESIQHRIRQKQQDRQQGGKPARPNELNGEGRQTQPQARPVADEASDPFTGIAEEVDSLDPELGTKLRAGAKGVHDELATAKSELAKLREFRRASNFADAFVEVLDEMPSLKGQHQAIRMALNELPESGQLLETSGPELLELVRRVAEDFGYVSTGPAKASTDQPKSQARNTPPKPSARGGTGRAAAKTLTPAEQDARELRALALTGFDEVKARELLRTGKV